MGEREDNEVPKGGFWTYKHWLAYVPLGVLLGLMAYFKAGGEWPF